MAARSKHIWSTLEAASLVNRGETAQAGRRAAAAPDVMLERELALVALDPVEPAEEEPEKDGERPVGAVRGEDVADGERVVLVRHLAGGRVAVEAREEGREGGHAGCWAAAGGAGSRERCDRAKRRELDAVVVVGRVKGRRRSNQRGRNGGDGDLREEFAQREAGRSG